MSKGDAETFVRPVFRLRESALLGRTGAFPALASATGHAHEMLFGFALAVIAGTQSVPSPPYA
ncbi:MAG: hypothetical protein ABI409_09040, partial [Ramlibacter sp.]